MPEGFIVNFLGVVTRTEFWEPYHEIDRRYPQDRHVFTEYPTVDEEFFEWMDLLAAILATENHFTMIELGAGWGRWTVNAAFTLKHLRGLPHTFVAVEAEPTHFRWLGQHLRDNALDPKPFCHIQAAVAPTDGKVGFHSGETEWGGPSKWYGNSIGGPNLVDAVSLSTLLQPLSLVDLIDLDVQGAEFEVLAAAATPLDKKVKRIHIGTHSARNEEGLRSLFGRLGWKCINDFSGSSSADTQWGRISFQDGVQTWVNPTFIGPNGDDIVTLTEKLHGSRREAERLWGELVKTREEQNQLQLMRQSAAWKFIERGKHWRDRIAPSGSRRRTLLDSIFKRT